MSRRIYSANTPSSPILHPCFAPHSHTFACFITTRISFLLASKRVFFTIFYVFSFIFAPFFTLFLILLVNNHQLSFIRYHQLKPYISCAFCTRNRRFFLLIDILHKIMHFKNSFTNCRLFVYIFPYPIRYFQISIHHQEINTVLHSVISPASAGYIFAKKNPGVSRIRIRNTPGGVLNYRFRQLDQSKNMVLPV